MAQAWQSPALSRLTVPLEKEEYKKFSYICAYTGNSKAWTANELIKEYNKKYYEEVKKEIIKTK